MKFDESDVDELTNIWFSKFKPHLPLIKALIKRNLCLFPEDDGFISKISILKYLQITDATFDYLLGKNAQKVKPKYFITDAASAIITIENSLNKDERMQELVNYYKTMSEIYQPQEPNTIV